MNGIGIGASTPGPAAAPTYTYRFTQAIRFIYYDSIETYLCRGQLLDKFGLFGCLTIHIFVADIH